MIEMRSFVKRRDVGNDERGGTRDNHDHAKYYVRY